MGALAYLMALLNEGFKILIDYWNVVELWKVGSSWRK
jgi:hypothetical protein